MGCCGRRGTERGRAARGGRRAGGILSHGEGVAGWGRRGGLGGMEGKRDGFQDQICGSDVQI